MDLLTTVAVSMLPVSRLKGASVFKEVRGSHPAGPLEAVLALSGPPADGLSTSEALALARARAETALAEGARLGIEAIPLWDPRYPALLACIPDPPPVLWTVGDPALAARPCVAVIGSRAATPYALQVARRLAAELADRGIVVVSGLARGVDSASHAGCLDTGGATIAVVGCGPDRIYPAENRALAAKIKDKGLLISELGPGAPPLPVFPRKLDCSMWVNVCT